MKLYNTLTRKVDDFKTHKEGIVNLYTCGPTVYSFQHVGNYKAYVNEDVLVKSLEYLGYKVNRVMNITDVGHLTSDSDSGEDKMVKAAKSENKSVLQIAKFYTEDFFKNTKMLNIDDPKVIAPATSYIDDMIHMVEVLLEKGYAYISGGNVYYDTSKKKDYYKLTNNTQEDLMNSSRDGIIEDNNKKNPADFVLWFTKSKFENQELKWDSPFGVGYPGWHLECSTIAIKNLGEYLDLHCGGVDHIFPHHTNEIAQSEGYLGHEWCPQWFHVEFLNNLTGKISKSKGDKLSIITLKEKGYDPLSFRYMCLSTSYRKQLMFSYEILDSMQNTYYKLIRKTTSITEEGIIQNDMVEKYNNLFKNAISDDINTPNALAVLYEVLKNDDLSGKTKIKLISMFDKVFSLDLLTKKDFTNTLEIDESQIKELIEKRNIAKQNKDYQASDEIRDELLSKNIILKDTREGTIWEIKK